MNKFIYNDDNDIWGNPQLFKNINVYPIKLKDYDYYKSLSYILFNKDTIVDKVVIKSSKLKFLVGILPNIKFSNDEKFTIDDFLDFFYFVFNLEKTKYHISIAIKRPEKDFVFQKYIIYITNKETNELFETISEKEFDEVLNIIERQNLLKPEVSQYEHLLKNPEVKRLLDEALAKKKRLGKFIDSATFMEEIFAFHVETHIELDKIKEYTFFQFRNMLNRCNIIIDYKVLKPLEYSGAIEMKTGKILHWLEHYTQPSPYDGILVDKSKGISSVNDKLGNKK